VVDGPTAVDDPERDDRLEGRSPNLYPAWIFRAAPAIPLAVAVRSVCVQARNAPVQDVRQAVPDALRVPGDAWRGFPPDLSPPARLAAGLRRMAFGWSCRRLCRGFGSIFRLRLCAFGRSCLPVVLRFRVILCMRRGRQRRGETTEEKPVKQPGRRRSCFYCHDSLSVLKDFQAGAGRGRARHQSVSLGCSIWAAAIGVLVPAGEIR
jgi:hypothetical protein